MNNTEENQIIAKALEILSRRVLSGQKLQSPADAIQFLTLQLAERTSEAFCVLYLSTQHQVIAFEEAFHGTIDGAAVYPRASQKRASCRPQQAGALGPHQPKRGYNHV